MKLNKFQLFLTGRYLTGAAVSLKQYFKTKFRLYPLIFSDKRSKNLIGTSHSKSDVSQLIRIH